MILDRFRRRLRKYGYGRLIRSPDFILSILLTLSLYSISKSTCTLSHFSCITVENEDFVETSLKLLFALTSFVVTGLAILVSFTDEDFLGELSDLGVYTNILFFFEYNIYLILTTALVGILYVTYDLGRGIFHLQVFLLTYSILSITELVELIANTGINKARFEEQKMKED